MLAKSMLLIDAFIVALQEYLCAYKAVLYLSFFFIFYQFY